MNGDRDANERTKRLLDAAETAFPDQGRPMDARGRVYSGRVPSLLLADSEVFVYIPSFVPFAREGTGLTVRTQSGLTVDAGSIRMSEESGTAPMLVPIEELGIAPLDGFRVMLDGSVLFGSPPQYFIFFDAFGRRTGGTSLCTDVLIGTDSVLEGSGFGYTESYRPDGTCLVSFTEIDGSRRFRVRPLEAGESARFRVVCAPDRRTSVRITGILEGHPAEEFEPAGGAGFHGLRPRVLMLDGRPVLSVPAYSGEPDEPFEAVLEWPDGNADLGRLPRASERGSMATFADLGKLGADLAGGLVLRIDGGVAYRFPPSELSLFSEDGVLTDMPEGRCTAVITSGKVLCGDGFEVLEEHGCGGCTIASIRVDPDGIVLADDEEWEDGPDEDGTPDEPADGGSVAGCDEAPSDAPPGAVLFPDGLPTMAFDGRDFVIRIPSLTAPGPSSPAIDLVVGGRTVSSVRLSGTVRDGSMVTRPATIDLRKAGASPFDDVSVLLDGRPVFRKVADDSIVMDRGYTYTGAPDGTVVVAMRKGTRFGCPDAEERSRRTVNGIVLATFFCHRSPGSAAYAVDGPETEDASEAETFPEETPEPTAAVSFMDDPLELSVKPLSTDGRALTRLEEASVPCVPFFDHSPRIIVAASRCPLMGCSVEVRDPDGRNLFGPVRACSGLVFLDTGGYSGFARATVSFAGTELASVDYLVNPGFWFELPEGPFIHSGNRMMKFGWNRRAYKFTIRDGIPLGYGSRPAVVRANVVLYRVGITVCGMRTVSFLDRRDVGSTELGERITVDAIISGEGTPVFQKMISVSAGNGPAVPLTRTWTEGEMTASASGFLGEMAEDHLDRHVFIEEIGRGRFEFLTVKWVQGAPSDE